ncbi:MAG: type II toxin-antitoxin system RelE/ParE family toxin [Flavobacterium sp.]|uniref:type II toxin-antitoxin system RelE/ParE family toxin n=1 Tax=Flavobacterium sp. TaxID=239 RepID=UPI002B49D9A9|nr:type II toxin-antitoxin system RelE/ParE family toxin [Flavobacterium sp.]WRH73577.1 MAG: type II toxin-antitoxin system RelE/ParE family toxin [Flavobacterium sp.]
MKSVLWSKASLDSLETIYNFIFENSPQNAEMVVDTLLNLGDDLAKFPERNPKEPLYNDESIRYFPKWNFKIVYRIEENRILIINIYSTKMNW